MKRVWLFGCMLGLSGLLLPTRPAAGGDLEPSGEAPVIDQHMLGVWSVNVDPDSATAQLGRRAFHDNLLFEADGRFTAEAFGPMGFGTTPYTVTVLADGVTGFTSTMSNDGQGTLIWNGVRRGSTIVGTLVWTRSDGSVSTYNFQAERVSEE